MASDKTGKQRVALIPLDYYKRADGLKRWKQYLAGGAALATLGWWLSGLVGGPSASQRNSHGPLARVHATWDNRCEACHVDFTALRDDAWAVSKTGTTATDEKCQSCHLGAIHHGSTNPLGCASCHHEHEGRDASLVRTDDKSCVRCHANLGAFGSGATMFANVTSFPGDHPDFTSLRQDPGSLKFSHATHMSPGLVAAANAKHPLTLSDLGPSDRNRYRRAGQGDADLVRLDCQTCHRANRVDFPALASSDDLLPPGLPEAYMLPVSYERDCHSCHPLTPEPSVSADAPLDLLPHGQSPEKLREILKDRLARRYLEDNPDLLKRRVPPRPMPGKRDELDASARTLLAARLETAEGHVHTVCAKCHEYESAAAPGLQAVVPARVPRAWLQHARFDHAAHRAVDCRQCHARAYADAPDPSKTRADVLIAGRDTCRKCHAPQSGELGGARFDCVECHRYHDGDSLLHRLGVSRRQAAASRSISEFLRGVQGTTQDQDQP